MILLWFACAPKAPPAALGPYGLACEGLTAITVDPDPWASVQTIQVTVGTQQRSTVPGRPVIVPSARATEPLTLTLDAQTCTLTPAGTGGETGICGTIGVALHYTPLCELPPTRVVLASTETLLLDTRERCLLDTHGYHEIEAAQEAGQPHQTCGGRPPGDHVDGGIQAVPTQPAFPWLKP